LKSSRHHEYVKIATGETPGDSVAAWVVYPQVRGKAPVVLVVHEIYGLTTWIRAVADQLAADGFIAIAPDLMTGKISPATPDSAPQLATQIIRTLSPATVHAQLKAVGNYGLSLPAAKQGTYAVVGFCWGGSTAFAHAVANPELGAAVVFYGSSPASADLSRVKAPVLGLYGELDARVNVSIASADSALQASGRKFDWQMYAGAGHGFLRNQDGMSGANLAAAKLAWPRTVVFLRNTVGR
jgi:carboxymethylenebutenolidase